MELFKLVGKIFVDSAEAENSISKVGDKADGLGGKMAAGLKTAGKWAAGIAAGATAIGGAMIAAAKESAATLDVIDKGAQRMKVSAESYQELAYAAGLSGVEMSTLEKAAKKLEGTDLNLDQALTQIQQLGTAEERSAAAAELFGEAVAYQMTPLLNAGAEGMASMRQEANDLGLVMSQDSVTAGAEMNDMFSKVEQSLSTLKTSLASELMPYVAEILEWLIANLPQITQTIKDVFDRVIPIIEPILRGVMGLLQSVMALINGDFDGFAQGLMAMFEGLATALGGIAEGILNTLLGGFEKAWDGVKSWIEDKVNWVKDKFSSIGSAISNAFGIGGGVNGSHAAGLPFVPFDGYRAELHRGETVVNATDASQLLNKMDNIANNAGGNANNGPIEISLNIDGQAFARATYNYNKAETNRRGTSLVMA